MAYLEDLDPGKLSPETSIRVGLALRQLGLVNLQQGKSAESLAAFERSRQLFQKMLDKYPDRNDVLFELGQAEFYVGNYYHVMGDPDSAWIPWNSYYEISRILYDADPADRKWLLELSYASMNLILLRVRSEQTVDEQLLEDVVRTVNLAEQALAAWPGNSEVLAHYSNTLAWAADAQYKACNLVAALHYRQLTLDQAERAANGDPSNKALQRSRANRQTGLASVHDGRDFEEAERHAAR
jgi:tetratricopeptide (TPR) repeat protein